MLGRGIENRLTGEFRFVLGGNKSVNEKEVTMLGSVDLSDYMIRDPVKVSPGDKRVCRDRYHHRQQDLRSLRGR